MSYFELKKKEKEIWGSHQGRTGRHAQPTSCKEQIGGRNRTFGGIVVGRGARGGLGSYGEKRDPAMRLDTESRRGSDGKGRMR